MSRTCQLATLLLAYVASCHSATQVALPSPVATFSGTVKYEDGTAPDEAAVFVTEIQSGKHVDIAPNKTGQFSKAMPPGRYALAVSTADAYAWVETVTFPSNGLEIVLKKTCNQLSGEVVGDASSSRVEMERQSSATGDTFLGSIDQNGKFRLCLPDGQYKAVLTGRSLSRTVTIDLNGPANVQLQSFAAGSIRLPPPPGAQLTSSRDGLIEDILSTKASIIGLGEATHGTAEFCQARGELTFELIQRAGVRLLMFEVDAIASVELDRYVVGEDVDVANAVTALGFWITDTYEFRAFLDKLRQYNSTVPASKKVRIWGVDVQNTTLPVNVLMANASELSITRKEQAVVSRMGKRAKGVISLSPSERSSLDALLTRLSTPRGPTAHDLLNAVAAKSLLIQINYWTGDMPTWYRKRRDHGMAEMAGFLAEQMGGGRAVLWAHAAHITKEPDSQVLGHHLATTKGGYYAIGFYLYEGSARAWDHASKVGVIPHPISAAPSYAVEAAIMNAAAMPDVAWATLRRLPSELVTWMATPRYVREIYATFDGDDASLILRDIPAAFDALVVIHTGHDSTPTPTGVRTVEKK